jgi:hypothetical protein
MMPNVTSSTVTISHINTPPGGSNRGRVGAGALTSLV